MIDPDNVPSVADEELLARFIMQSKLFRKDGTVSANALMPYRRVELSMTRHQDAIEEEVWTCGMNVADAFGRKLYGRIDIRAGSCQIDSLRVVASPLEQNPNHADIVGWPPAKQDQKAIALKLAASASKLIPTPRITGPGLFYTKES